MNHSAFRSFPHIETALGFLSDHPVIVFAVMVDLVTMGVLAWFMVRRRRRARTSGVIDHGPSDGVPGAAVGSDAA